jgi:hypothetical protein
MSEETIAVLVVQDEGDSPIRWNTAPNTPEWRESLQKQADRLKTRGSRAWVQTERKDP